MQEPKALLGPIYLYGSTRQFTQNSLAPLAGTGCHSQQRPSLLFPHWQSLFLWVALSASCRIPNWVKSNGKTKQKVEWCQRELNTQCHNRVNRKWSPFPIDQVPFKSRHGNLPLPVQGSRRLGQSPTREERSLSAFCYQLVLPIPIDRCFCLIRFSFSRQFVDS